MGRVLEAKAQRHIIRGKIGLSERKDMGGDTTMGERHPKPMCSTQVGADWIDEGTMSRSRSSPPGPVGLRSGHMGTQDKTGAALKRLQMDVVCPRDFTPYPWMEWAFLALGYGVKKGKDRPVIYDFLRYAGRNNAGDETPWCSAFVNYCMEQAGIRGTRKANARSWLDWGDMSLRSPQLGCVVILW